MNTPHVILNNTLYLENLYNLTNSVYHLHVGGLVEQNAVLAANHDDKLNQIKYYYQ